MNSHIKVLQTLGLSFVPVCYRHEGPKGPKEVSFDAQNLLETRTLILEIL